MINPPMTTPVRRLPIQTHLYSQTRPRQFCYNPLGEQWHQKRSIIITGLPISQEEPFRMQSLLIELMGILRIHA